MKAGNNYLENARYKTHTPEHDLWSAMMKRCYSPLMQEHSPTYKGCTVSDSFQDFQWFGAWCNRQIGFDIPGRQLDKDILIKWNKHYSEDTCVFVPREINNLFIRRRNDRGNLPIGVSLYKGIRFNVQVSRDNGPRHVGYFATVEEAFAAYKTVKEEYIRYKAEKWKDRLDPRVYAALITYEVHIDD